MSIIYKRMDWNWKIAGTGFILGLLTIVLSSWIDHATDYHLDTRDCNTEHQQKEEARNDSKDGNTTMYEDKNDGSRDEHYHDGKSIG